jgi:hypothetical protein
MSIKLLNKKLTRKEKTETSQVGGEIALTLTPKVG